MDLNDIAKAVSQVKGRKHFCTEAQVKEVMMALIDIMIMDRKIFASFLSAMGNERIARQRKTGKKKLSVEVSE